MTMTEKNIQLIDIDKELKGLWDSGQGQNCIHASLFNLIVYVQKSEKRAFYHDLIKSVISKFPCRVLLILVDEKEDALRTRVASETVRSGDMQIYCEVIQIEASGTLTERVPFIVLPHILPDLPIYLLWTQDPSLENAILPYLETFAWRIIFDSDAMQDPQTFSKTVGALKKRFHCQIGDLNWSALSGIRTLFARVFDDQEMFFCLIQSKIIRIAYNRLSSNGRHPEIEALYFQAWLASRLNWKFQRIEINEGNIRITYKRALAEVAFVLTPQENQELKQGTLLSIDLESARNKAHFSFKRHPKTRQIFMQYSDKERCDLPTVTNLSGASEGQEIVDEIFYPTGTSHYCEMLDLLSQIPWGQR